MSTSFIKEFTTYHTQDLWTWLLIYFKRELIHPTTSIKPARYSISNLSIKDSSCRVCLVVLASTRLSFYMVAWPHLYDLNKGVDHTPHQSVDHMAWPLCSCHCEFVTLLLSERKETNSNQEQYLLSTNFYRFLVFPVDSVHGQLLLVWLLSRILQGQ